MRMRGPAATAEEDPSSSTDSTDSSADTTVGDDTTKRFQGETDFMNDIEKNTRDYFHKIRRDFDRFDRIDFTQTLLFTSAKELEYTRERTYTVSSGFYLNDQVSTFQIQVNLFRSDGKYGFAKRDLVSSMPAYSKFTLPISLVRGDKIDVPISVVNNHSQPKNVVVRVKEYVFSPRPAEVANFSQDLTLGPKSQGTVVF